MDVLVIVILVLSIIGFFAVMMFDWDERIVGGCMVTLIVSFIVLIGMVVVYDSDHKERLMQQCMEDGKKEYECESMLRKPQSNIVPMPVVIPVR